MLRTLLSNTIREAVSNLQLPEPSKKVQKIIDRSSKRLACAYKDVLKKEEKKRKKAEKALHAGMDGESKKKRHKNNEVNLTEPVKL
jgi:hypothetical protein